MAGPGWSMEALLACTNSPETSCTASTNCPNNVFVAFLQALANLRLLVNLELDVSGNGIGRWEMMP